MLNRFFELLGMSDDYDDEDIVITSHKDDKSVDDKICEEVDKRAKRLKKPMPARPEMVFCRGRACTELLDDMIIALKQGRIILLDLNGVDDVKGGQETLNKIYETALSMKGALIRVSKTVFLATPVKTACEEWVVEEGGEKLKEIKNGA